MTQDFVRNIKQYAEENNVPIVHFKHRERKDDIAAQMRRKYPVKNGVVFIGIAQEKAYAFKGRKKAQSSAVMYTVFRFGSSKRLFSSKMLPDHGEENEFLIASRIQRPASSIWPFLL